MNRRKFISGALISSLTSGLSLSSLGMLEAQASPLSRSNLSPKVSGATRPSLATHSQREQGYQLDSHVKDAVNKAKDFEQDYANDIYLSKHQRVLLRSTLNRLTRLQRLVGYANFNLISFDSAIVYARRYPVVGRFSKREIALIEALYVYDASNYGFLGQKVSEKLTDKIVVKEVKKIAGSGHYLYQGEALKLYQKLKKELSNDLILTSGIRSVVKQLHLFMAKADKSDGNLSRAARSLAPPGHSFHGIGDFDVGQKGLGAANFTSAFMETKIHQQLTDLGLIAERYPESNPFGVRHEPWHIKVIRDV